MEDKKQVTLDLSNLSMPNMEFIVYIAALVVMAIVAGISKTVNVGYWVEVFKWSTVAYLLSRGIAKAHNVKE